MFGKGKHKPVKHYELWRADERNRLRADLRRWERRGKKRGKPHPDPTGQYRAELHRWQQPPGPSS